MERVGHGRASDLPHRMRADLTRRRLVRSGAVAAIVLLLAACGVVPTAPDPNPGSPSPAGSPAVVTPSSDPSSPTPEVTPAPAPPTWVGRFEGKRVEIPYGHGAAVSFTFDDGPSPEFTPPVLALLARNHVPAVFCLIGTQAQGYPRLVRREVRAGHTLCDHSRDHDLNMNGRGRAYVEAEVADGLAAVHHAAPGVPVPFYRQPGGFWSPTVVRAMKANRLAPLRWSDDPRDWSRPGSAAIVGRVVRKLHPGAVVLMHDGGGDRSQTVEALAWLLPSLRAAGWTFVTAPVERLTDRQAAIPQ